MVTRTVFELICATRCVCITLQEWQFFDTARLNVKGGDGGDGCVAFRREKGIAMGGPSGGNGARGGTIYLTCDHGLNTLSTVRNKVHYKGLDGSVRTCCC